MAKPLRILPYLAILLISAAAAAFDGEDFQYWPRVAVEAKVCERWRASLYNEGRLGDDATSLYHDQTELAAVYEINRYFAVGPAFRYVYTRGSNGTSPWNSQYWPIAAAWITYDFGPVALSDRNRVEYRVVQGSENRWVYRNRLDVDLPVVWKRIKLRPYVANEVFVDVGQSDLGFDWLYGGFKMSPATWIALDIYYMRDFAKNNGWKAYNVLGTSIKFLF